MAVICETQMLLLEDKAEVRQYWHDIHHQAHGYYTLVLLEGFLKTSSFSLGSIMTFKVCQHGDQVR